MRLPRRLGHGESAEIVEHLGELRSRLIVSLLALAVGFGVGYAFHEQLIRWLNAPLPPGTKPVTLSVTYEGAPTIRRFWADPPTINAGESAVLRWEVVNADEVTIKPGVGRVDAQGPFRVIPQTTTTYYISAASSKGTVRRNVTVEVKR